MKKPTTELYERQRRRSLRRMRELVSLNHRPPTHQPRRRIRTPITREIEAPSQVRFHGNETVRRVFWNFVGSVRQSLERGDSVRLDLRSIETLHPCGLLLLLSHVRSWALSYPDKVTATYPSDDVVEQMLQVVGILKKLGLESRKEVTREEVTRWYYYHGEDVDASSITPFMDVAREILGEVDQTMLYDCIVEAITNVRHHAYEGDEPTRWWMFASVIDNGITVAIYDAGLSIPGTLMQKPGVVQQVAHWAWGRKKADARLIHAAMGGRSRTKLAYRGKGLQEMLESTKRTPGSNLSIYSRDGVFVYIEKDAQEASDRLTHPVEGTLLLWSLKIPERHES